MGAARRADAGRASRERLSRASRQRSRPPPTTRRHSAGRRESPARSLDRRSPRNGNATPLVGRDARRGRRSVTDEGLIPGVVMSGTGGVWQVRTTEGEIIDASLRGRLKKSNTGKRADGSVRRDTVLAAAERSEERRV